MNKIKLIIFDLDGVLVDAKKTQYLMTQPLGIIFGNMVLILSNMWKK